tara:strand:- start:8 stop:583 length:576 start_codon:yes stop_codon:yes gene_type:complete
MSEEKYYDVDYWYNNPEEHADVSNYNKDYYAYKIYENVILKLKDVPDEGYIVLLGTNRCVSFNLLCEHFGYERCIGYDIHNPTNHPRVKIKDCNLLSDMDNIPIAFCHNDLGSFPTTPKLKAHGQEWAAKNFVKGGYFLGRNNLNSAKYKSEELMESHGFENIHFKDIQDKYDMSKFEHSWIEGHMLSRKL